MPVVGRLCVAVALTAVLGAGGPASARLPDCLVPGFDDRCELWAARIHEAGETTIAHWISRPSVLAGDDVVFTTGTRGQDVSDLSTVAHDGATGATLWETPLPGASPWGPIPQVLSPDQGTLYVAGSLGGRITVAAHDTSTGEIMWQATAGTVGGATPSYPRGLAVDGTGENLYVGGVTSGRGGRDLVVMALDPATGSERWRRGYAGPAGRDEAGGQVAVDPSGERVYLAGTRDILPNVGNDHEEGDVVVLAFDTEDVDTEEGDPLWTASFGGPGGLLDQTVALEALDDGVYVGATLDLDFDTANEASDMGILAFDPATGERRWATVHGAPDGPDWLHRLVVDPAGESVYAAGATTALFTTALGSSAARYTHDPDGTVLAVDAGTGQVRWTRPLALPGHKTELATGLAVAPEGDRVYVTGLSEVAGYGFLAIEGGSFTADSGLGSYSTMALSADQGQPLWSGRFRAQADEGARAWGLSLAPDGSRLYVTGMVSRAVIDPQTAGMPSAHVTVAYTP